MVPETTPDIKEAFTKLTQLYGNVSRVLAFQKKKLSELGTFPSATGADAPRMKMQWLMDIQQIIKEYINIGDSGDNRMYCPETTGIMLPLVVLMQPLTILLVR